jgi:hypothetical protein
MLADVRPIVNLPVSLARQIHQYLVESQLIVLQQRHEEMERMMQEGMYISTALTEDDLFVVLWIVMKRYIFSFRSGYRFVYGVI